MLLEGLPLELFRAIVEELVNLLGPQPAFRLRLVSRT
jgi:hypothetical protein